MEISLHSELVAIKTTQQHIEKDIHLLREDFEKHEDKDDRREEKSDLRFIKIERRMADNTELLVQIDTKITTGIKVIVFAVTVILPISVYLAAHLNVSG